MASELVFEPNKDRVMEALNSNEMLSSHAFFEALDPKTFAGLNKPDMLDNVFNRLGLATPDVQRLRTAAEHAKALQPAYQKYLGFKMHQMLDAPSVGDAQTLFPGHKELIPEQAYKPVPRSPLEADDMPVMTGMRQETIPDTRFQGPMPGVMTSLGEFTQRQRDDVGRSGLSLEQNQNLDERSPYLFQEGPRPMRVRETGIYGPDTAPSQSIEVDKAMKLPPAFQAQLGAMQHQLSTRQPQAHYPSAEELKLDMGMKLGIQAWQEQHPGQPVTPSIANEIYSNVVGLYNKESRPGTPGYRKDTAQATQEEAKAKVADKRQNVEIADIEARTAENEAKENEIRILMDAKLRKLEAEAAAANATGSKESIKAYYQEQAALLGRAKTMMDIAIEGRKGGKLDDKSYTKLMDMALADMNVGLKADATEQSWFGKHFGTEKPVEVSPRPETEQPKSLRPSGAPKLPEFRQAPLPAQPSDDPEARRKADEEAEIIKFGRTLKEGETKPFKGSRWTRKNGKLIEVK